MAEQAGLRVYGQGAVEVELVLAYLTDLRHAYNSILVFDASIDEMIGVARDFRFTRRFARLALQPELLWPLGSRGGVQRSREWPPTAERVASQVPRAEQLILSAVSLASPGFWEFLGTLNPLEVLRKYLSDRHERRKDREYRESAEERKLLLENAILEEQVIGARIRTLKDAGATDRDLAPLLNELVYRPLTRLARSQDRGVIEHAEIPPDRDRG